MLLKEEDDNENDKNQSLTNESYNYYLKNLKLKQKNIKIYHIKLNKPNRENIYRISPGNTIVKSISSELKFNNAILLKYTFENHFLLQIEESKLSSLKSSGPGPTALKVYIYAKSNNQLELIREEKGISGWSESVLLNYNDFSECFVLVMLYKETDKRFRVKITLSDKMWKLRAKKNFIYTFMGSFLGAVIIFFLIFFYYCCFKPKSPI